MDMKTMFCTLSYLKLWHTVEYSLSIKLCLGDIGMDHVISKPYYKEKTKQGNFLYENDHIYHGHFTISWSFYNIMVILRYHGHFTISWSFSYNSFVIHHANKFLEQQHDYVIVCLIWFFTSQQLFSFVRTVLHKMNQYSAEDSVLLKDTTQCLWWDFTLQPIDLESSTLPMSHCVPHMTMLYPNMCYNEVCYKGHRFR